MGVGEGIGVAVGMGVLVGSGAAVKVGYGVIVAAGGAAVGAPLAVTMPITDSAEHAIRLAASKIRSVLPRGATAVSRRPGRVLLRGGRAARWTAVRSVAS